MQQKKRIIQSPLNQQNKNKNKMKKLLMCFIFFGLIGNVAFAEHNEQQERSKSYSGIGIGLDYGGIFGAKVEFLPIEHIGIFAGAGFNLWHC